MTESAREESQARARDFRIGDSRTYLGDVAVDGGEILMVDPTYVPDTKDVAIQELRAESPLYGAVGGPVFANKWTGEGYLAVAVRLQSDGSYPVWVERGQDGDVLRVTIEIALPESDH